jgi:hypothetical protein
MQGEGGGEANKRRGRGKEKIRWRGGWIEVVRS